MGETSTCPTTTPSPTLAPKHPKQKLWMTLWVDTIRAGQPFTRSPHDLAARLPNIPRQLSWMPPWSSKGCLGTRTCIGHCRLLREHGRRMTSIRFWFISALSNPKPGHTTGRSGRTAHSGAAEHGALDKMGRRRVSPRRAPPSLVPPRASKTTVLNNTPEARISEILCKPNAGTKCG